MLGLAPHLWPETESRHRSDRKHFAATAARLGQLPSFSKHADCNRLFWHRLSLAQSSMDREPFRVIVVEDHASTAEALRKFLTCIGYKVYVAPDIASARGLAKAVEFDVLLSDLRLPDGTGWDLMQELSATKPVRAIAISGHNTDVDIERSRKVGFLDHIAKPLVAEELTAAIERAVTKPRPTGARH